MSNIKAIVAGPRGKMGSEALKMIQNQSTLSLVACIDRMNDGMVVKEVEGLPDMDAVIYTDAAKCLSEVEADVLIDLTTPENGYTHAKLAIENGVRPVVGTTGFTNEELTELTELASEKRVGTVIAPNFAIGAVLMMQFSKWAAKHFPEVEIIEKHHDQKLDAPSGTAIKTAELIKEVRESHKQGHENETETLQGARGADVEGMKIHSMRLPGLVAHQEVVFGGLGETLTVKHDSIHRASFMSGVKLAAERVMDLDILVYGLEHLLD
ncbi:dihydrodipicolinate reductase [Halobacillus karajensis]|uniref:4-hydroxy-tetrahydrodipicolinate reductase n=1 Tax=Halobacillus karajensis TaxID=195088 RepID=A0A024P1H1_9BACI|nr:4-hydroxy-tetrahydrodipicolinate reductase [Halobacillus karajensis]CDQ19518.1 4-hydroxy-tetrahydrodipicolinate reductase [Halobacillus karajensis]CDQ21980.1 4-hydroxy-tetrahydrodipicolinate reductase [Halobacillus karajensis]CDQ27821.1 4-hydroxy-tetrahydrodipicolinate reductase [Halobacillus karajensis]SEH81007.1 dihydrodipicolinate reductase [Halobacillus karajensis]